MNSTNICRECKHSLLKLKILVPHNCTIKEYIHRTGDFSSDIVAISKEHGEYNVWFRSGENLKFLSFKILHMCKLKQRQEKSDKVGACEDYDLKSEETAISNITYSKMPSPEPSKH